MKHVVWRRRRDFASNQGDSQESCVVSTGSIKKTKGCCWSVRAVPTLVKHEQIFEDQKRGKIASNLSIGPTTTRQRQWSTLSYEQSHISAPQMNGGVVESFLSCWVTSLLTPDPIPKNTAG